MTSGAIPTLQDYLDFGIRAGLSMRRMISLYREAGNRIRTEDFAEAWRARKAQFESAGVR